MGTITVVNLADSGIQSAITNAHIVYSGINGILPNVYYHHSAVGGTGYDVWEKWYIPGITEDFPNSEKPKIGWYLGGALVTVAGLAATALSLSIPAVRQARAAFNRAMLDIQREITNAAIAKATLLTAKTASAVAAAVWDNAAAAVAADPTPANATALQAAKDAFDIADLDLENAAAAAAAAAAKVSFFAVRAAELNALNEFVSALGRGVVAGVALGVLAGIGGIGLAAGVPAYDYVKQLEKNAVGTVWGQDDRILSFTGNIPLNVSQQTDAQGNTTIVVQIPAGKTAKEAPPPKYNGDLTPQAFDLRRRIGEIYQIKHRDGEYGDVTQGLVRTNLKGGGGQTNIVTHGGITVDISHIYKIFLVDKNGANTQSCLMAGEDEGDYRVYLRKNNQNQELSCCFWQLIPTKEQGVPGTGGWILVDRRYVRFLYWSGSEILQYQSEQTGIGIDDRGFATNITRDGMVWDLSSFAGTLNGSIKQPGPGQNQICVTGRTDQDFPIYARPYGSDDVFQKWALVDAGVVTALYRLNHPNYDHFYTTSAAERDKAIAQYGYQSEGTACYVYDTQAPGTTALYRLLRPANGVHFYTTSAAERDKVIAQYGYQSEGTACYVYDTQAPGTTALYRLYNPQRDVHFYTTSAAERDNAIAQYRFQSEGIACYVYGA